jgi:hypothetical protein
VFNPRVPEAGGNIDAVLMVFNVRVWPPEPITELLPPTREVPLNHQQVSRDAPLQMPQVSRFAAVANWIRPSWQKDEQYQEEVSWQFVCLFADPVWPRVEEIHV